MIGTRNVLELSQRHGTRVVFASTSEVFGKNPNPPFAEDDDRVLGSTKTARWSYSTSKAMAEHLVFAMHSAYGLPVTVVRYFNVYGPRQNPIFVISQSIHRILNGRQPLLYDSGDQTRCFTYVDDAIAGTLLAADSDAAIGEAFNIGSMTETTMRTLSIWRSRSRTSIRCPAPKLLILRRATGVATRTSRVVSRTRPRRSGSWGGAFRSMSRRESAAPSSGRGPTRGISKSPLGDKA